MAGYSGPALIEANLPDYDKRELADERAMREAVRACKEAAKAAKVEMAKLVAEKKALDKHDPDFKKAAKDIDQRIKAFNGVAKKPCKLKHPGCVPSDNSSRISMPKEITDAINQKYGTKVDWNQLAAWEGGAYSKGYIPWWPYLNNSENPHIVVMPNSTGPAGPRIKGDLDGQPKNNSGTTVGVGVDLGTKDENFFNLLDATNQNTKMLTPAELSELKSKISPYFKRAGGEACKFLRAHPLELSQNEINFLNAAAHEDSLKTAIHKYEAFAKKARREGKLSSSGYFKDLSPEQQTALISNSYQYGKPKESLITAITFNNRNLIPPTREHNYLFQTMPDPTKK